MALRDVTKHVFDEAVVAAERFTGAGEGDARDRIAGDGGVAHPDVLLTQGAVEVAIFAANTHGVDGAFPEFVEEGIAAGEAPGVSVGITAIHESDAAHGGFALDGGDGDVAAAVGAGAEVALATGAGGVGGLEFVGIPDLGAVEPLSGLEGKLAAFGGLEVDEEEALDHLARVEDDGFSSGELHGVGLGRGRLGGHRSLGERGDGAGAERAPGGAVGLLRGAPFRIVEGGCGPLVAEEAGIHLVAPGALVVFEHGRAVSGLVVPSPGLVGFDDAGFAGGVGEPELGGKAGGVAHHGVVVGPAEDEHGEGVRAGLQVGGKVNDVELRGLRVEAHGAAHDVAAVDPEQITQVGEDAQLGGLWLGGEREAFAKRDEERLALRTGRGLRPDHRLLEGGSGLGLRCDPT